MQVVQGGQQFATRQVSRATYDDDVLWGGRLEAYCFFTACPPNSFRRAAMTFMAKASS